MRPGRNSGFNSLRLAALALAATAWPALAQQNQPGHDCSIDGSVTDSVTNLPIARARVQLTGSASLSTAADAAGRWRFEGTACGPVQVTAARPGYLRSPAVRSGNGTPTFPITLRAGNPAHDIVVKLKPQAVIQGHVTDESGDPVAGATVTLFASRVADGRRSMQIGRTTQTNDLGEYRLAALDAGRYGACVHASQQFVEAASSDGAVVYGDQCWPGPMTGGQTQGVAIAVGGNQRVDFSLAPSSAVHVRGQVSGLPKGRTVGVTLMPAMAMAGGGNNRPGVVRPNGQFDIGGVVPGAYVLVADLFLEQGRRLSARTAVNVGAADLDGVVLQLDAGFTLAGRLQMEDAASNLPTHQQIALNLRGVAGTPGSGQVVWGNANEFSFNDVLPGTYTVAVFVNPPFFVRELSIGGRDVLQDEVMLTPGAGPLVVVLGDKPGTAQGEVSDAEGKPVPASVMLLGKSGKPYIVATGPQGRFTVPGIPPGDYTAYAWDDPDQVEYADGEWMKRYGSGGVPVRITAGQPAMIRLTRQSIAP